MSVFAAPGAYDRAITVFSPDGRLFQVEYAMEVVNRGATILGIQTAEGVVLGSEESIEPLDEAGDSYKIFRVDDHVGAAIVGLSSDARILIEQARIHSQSNKLTYDEPIDVEIVTKKICDIQQMYTQHAGVRPFGVSLIFAGVDKTGSRVFGTHPSGTYRGYKATALGAGRETVLNILKEEYKDNMSLEDIIKLAANCLVKALETRQLPPRIKIAVIPATTKKLEMLSDEQIDTYIKGSSSSK
ncbi:MAG: archaeal proteasome endopeptidase complex subunit alpha [Candidatus Bathyarchaeota archaeon]|jgi:proteasome alpha subunit|nr:archaeal proteasome endopeptidase complex subunit alpha [Candidatus Termiticorpusculum sp.]MCL1970730.1 archaeal proteasome endopeptidase complex subunit alpha [Candidatus Termiticorpusculum sp.]